jgi:hypothetical protein
MAWICVPIVYNWRISSPEDEHRARPIVPLERR